MRKRSDIQSYVGRYMDAQHLRETGKMFDPVVMKTDQVEPLHIESTKIG